MATTVIWKSLSSCAGCEISLLNLGESVLDVLAKLDIGIVSGGVRSQRNLEVLLEVRSKVEVLISLGTCAATGGLPGLSNLCGARALTDFSFEQSPTARCTQKPNPAVGGIPAMLPEFTPLTRHVAVDVVVPGCPPHPDWIEEAIAAVLEGRSPVLPDRSVCSVCPAVSAVSGGVSKAPLRSLRAPLGDPTAPLSAMPCFLAQGYVCLGPVTRAGCGGREGAPQCIAGRAPCRGCYGPVRADSVASLDFLEALAVAGHDPAAMPDKPGYLSRFTGAPKPPSGEKPS